MPHLDDCEPPENVFLRSRLVEDTSHITDKIAQAAIHNIIQSIKEEGPGGVGARDLDANALHYLGTMVEPSRPLALWVGYDYYRLVAIQFLHHWSLPFRSVDGDALAPPYQWLYEDQFDRQRWRLFLNYIVETAAVRYGTTLVSFQG